MARPRGKKKEPATQAVKAPELGYVTGTNIPRTAEKVVIVGFAPSSMHDASAFFGDPNYEIWGLNQLYIVFPEIQKHATRWFQIHHRASYDANVRRDMSHHGWMQQVKDFPIYMQEQNQDVPMSVPFPRDMIEEAFNSRYFTNSISWEIALAVLEGFKEIHVYGVDMAQSSEYSFERPSVEYWLGIAAGRGIKVVLPDATDLLKTMWVYPFENPSPFRQKIDARRNELRQRAGQHAAAESSEHDARMQVLGALDNMNYIMYAWESSQKELVQQWDVLKKQGKL